MPRTDLDTPSRSTDPDPFLQLDPHSLILPGENSLQLINRRGAVDLQAKNLQHLHQVFAPHLDGSRRRSELVAAVGPDQASAVGSYLDTLRRSGAFVDVQVDSPGDAEEDRAAAGLPLESLGASRPHGRFLVGSHGVSISLAGPVAASEESFLVFLSPAEALEQLAELRRIEVRERAWRTVVVTESSSPATPRELERRARIARWLLTTAAGPRDNLGLLQVFHLGAGLSLQRKARIASEAGNGEAGRIDSGDGRIGLATLPDQLGLIDPGDREQLPLSVARARRPFGEPFGPWFYGLHFEDVREALLARSFDRIAGELLGPVPFFFGKLGEPTATYVRRSAGAEAPTLLHAGRLRHLRLALLEQRESRLAESDGRSVDLLREPGDERVRCVQRLLALHVGSLPGRRAKTPGGATVFAGGSLRSCSFFAPRALLDILLQALHGAQNPADRDPAVPALPLPEDDREIDRLVARFSNVSVALRGTTFWGRTVWSGYTPDLGDAS